MDTRRVNAALVEFVEELLADAKSGEMQSLIIVGSRFDATTLTGHAGDVQANAVRILGELSILEHSFVNRFIDTWEAQE